MSLEVKKDAASDDNEYESEGEQKHTMQYLLNSPAYMSAVMRRQLLHEMFKKLPAVAQGRVHALKNIQLKQVELEAKFYEEVYELERKYQTLYQPLQDQRRAILEGAYEPTAEEIVPLPGTETDEEAAAELSEKLHEISIELRRHLKTIYPVDVKGVPDFWLTIFRSTDLLSTMIQPQDEALLKQLIDIKVVYEEDMSYTMEFHFKTNEWFKNEKLTKQYFLKSKVDEEDPFSFEGPEIYKCVGCTIDWLPGKNLTVKTIKKKQKHKARGAVRTVNKQVPADSFFNFFNPPQVPEDVDEAAEEDTDSQAILSTDYEIGHFLRARVIPKAVLYYTGDLVDDDEDDDFDEEEEEEEDSDEDDDDDDDVKGKAYTPKFGKQNEKAKPKAGGPKQENPAECKQQ